MTDKILCVDDESNVLEAFQRALRRQFHIDTALGGTEGLEAIANCGPYAVVVSDMRMPRMDGIQFLSRVREQAPDTVRIMLTGNVDLHTAIDAVNEGNVFRFLTKPCSPEILAKALAAGIQQYRLVSAEKELLEKTLRSSIQVLTDILALVNPTAFSRAARVRRLVVDLASELKVQDAWQIEIAAMLSQIGCVTVPEEALAKIYRGAHLTAEELRMFQAHPQIGSDLIARIPRLENVAAIIAYQEKLYDGSGHPHDDKRGQDIPLGARILKLALDFDKLEATGISKSEAFDKIQRRGNWYDPLAVEALGRTLAKGGSYEIRSADVNDLTFHMVLAEDILLENNLLLVAKGQEVTPSLQARLGNFAQKGIIGRRVKVRVPVGSGPVGPTHLSKSQESTYPSELESDSRLNQP